MSTTRSTPPSRSRRSAIRPPSRRPRSSTRTGSPARSSTRAQAMPAIPAPTTTTGSPAAGHGALGSLRRARARARPAGRSPRGRWRSAPARRARRSRRRRATARRAPAGSPRFGTCSHGTGPWPRQPARRSASRPAVVAGARVGVGLDGAPAVERLLREHGPRAGSVAGCAAATWPAGAPASRASRATASSGRRVCGTPTPTAAPSRFSPDIPVDMRQPIRVPAERRSWQAWTTRAAMPASAALPQVRGS